MKLQPTDRILLETVKITQNQLFKTLICELRWRLMDLDTHWCSAQSGETCEWQNVDLSFIAFDYLIFRWEEVVTWTWWVMLGVQILVVEDDPSNGDVAGVCSGESAGEEEVNVTHIGKEQRLSLVINGFRRPYFQNSQCPQSELEASKLGWAGLFQAGCYDFFLRLLSLFWGCSSQLSQQVQTGSMTSCSVIKLVLKKKEKQQKNREE